MYPDLTQYFLSLGGCDNFLINCNESLLEMKQSNKPNPLKLFSQSLTKCWNYRPNCTNPIIPLSLLHSVSVTCDSDEAWFKGKNKFCLLSQNKGLVETECFFIFGLTLPLFPFTLHLHITTAMLIRQGERCHLAAVGK